MADPDISGMPDPATVGLKPDDLTNGMPDPKTLYQQYHGYPAQGPEEVTDFMNRFSEGDVPDVRKEPSGRYMASSLTGLPRAAVGLLATPLAGVASIAGHATGAFDSMAALAANREDLIPAAAARGTERAHRWSEGVNNLANYITAPITTKPGEELSNRLLEEPSVLIGGASDATLGKALSDNAYQAVKHVGREVGTDLQALGLPMLGRLGARGVGAAASVAKKVAASEAATLNPAHTEAPAPLTPPVGQPITGDTLRAQPNPIPPPEGTAASARAPINAPTEPNAPVNAPTAAAEPPAATPTQVPATEPTAQGVAPTGPVTAAERYAANRALIALDQARESERGSARLFNSPKEEGPQETPRPEEQSERAGHLEAIDQLSGGGLPTRRQSAISGDYNATGRDWADKETDSPTMVKQVASENNALHTAADNVHRSVGSEFDDSVDPETLGNRGRVTRGAIQSIEKHFGDMTDGIYDAARESNQGKQIPKLQRVHDYLNDDSNFTNDAEIGLQRAAKQRLGRLWSTGDPDKGAPPGSVNAAERFREFLNEKGKNPQAMGVANDLKGHVDMDVAEHGGPGLFEAARAMRRHKYQMLEEPTGIKKLLTPGDSQGINHAIPEHKVMDYIADLPREQHEHVLNVLRAGAHLTPELAESSAAAIREIQAHTLSRLHAAATDDGGKWNASGFYRAASRYGRNAAETFKDRPDVLKNLKTLNDAGNTLHMDRHYPGAVGQGEKATGLGSRALTLGGNMVASLAHEIPAVGRMVGRAIERGVEKASGQMGETAREKEVASRLVDRTGKQRGSVGVMSQRDAIEHATNPDKDGTILHHYKVPGKGGGLVAKEYPERGVTQVHLANVNDNLKGQGWGTRMLQRAADDAHAKGQVLHSDQQVSEGQAGAYKNLSQLGYDVKMKDNDVRGGARHAVGDHVFEVRPGKSQGSMLNVGLHQGQEGQPGFRKMSKQEAQGAVESTGAKVTKASVLTPDTHGVPEPTLVASTNRPLSEPEMQQVLAKTKQSAIPQRTDAGVESMHIAPGHEEIAKREGWDKFNPEYFRGHEPPQRYEVTHKGGSAGDRATRADAEALSNRLQKMGAKPEDVQIRDRSVRIPAAQRGSVRVTSGKDSHLNAEDEGAVPDNAHVYTSVNDKTKAIQGYAVTVPHNGAHTMTDIHVEPQYRRQGIGAELYKNAVEGAHKQGLPFHSDTSVTPEQMANVNKSGYQIERNPNVSTKISKYGGRDTAGPVLMSNDGKPVYTIPVPKDQRGSVRVMNERPLTGAPEGDQPNGKARAAAAAYKRSAGIDTPPLKEYRYVDPKVAKSVGDAYEEMKHDPTNPKVAKSYAAFKAETLAQYKQMQKAGVKVDFDQNYPYKNPREMHADVRDNNHMSLFPTVPEAGGEGGFGANAADFADHPLLEKAPVKIGGKDATYNDIFRAVHDYFGHAAEGNGFRANGEYNAWRAHRQIYSADARGAMDAETLGQNSWVNSGPPAALNKGASSADTIYADQKAGLLPRDVVKAAEEGVGADEHHITNQLTDKERSQLRVDTTKRLVDAFNGAPATEEYAAAALAGAAKRGWYRNSSQAIVNQFGHEAPRFAGLLAAMSPQVSVQTNFANALKTYINWDKAGRPEDPTTIRRIMEDSSQKSEKNEGSNVLDAWVNNVVRALTSDDPSNVKLSGPKVHSFYNNLIDNVNEVTNDAWMAAFAKVDPAKLKGGINKAGTATGKSPTYLALSGKVRQAASMLSRLTGETWTPAEVQETVWSWAKTAYEHAEEKGSDVSIPSLVKNGDITDELIRSTPDFHQLFGTSEHRGLLQSSRFAGNAERVASGQEQSTNTAGSSQARQAAEAALRPHLISAAERLESLRRERRAAGVSQEE